MIMIMSSSSQMMLQISLISILSVLSLTIILITFSGENYKLQLLSEIEITQLETLLDV